MLGPLPANCGKCFSALYGNQLERELVACPEDTQCALRGGTWSKQGLDALWLQLVDRDLVHGQDQISYMNSFLECW